MNITKQELAELLDIVSGKESIKNPQFVAMCRNCNDVHRFNKDTPKECVDNSAIGDAIKHIQKNG